MGDLDLKGLRALVDAMTPAPWHMDPFDGDIIDGNDRVVGYAGDEDVAAVLALRNSADALLSRIEELEAQAAKTDEVLAATVAKWEEMERCAYNICAHCKEPFERGEAMSRHAQTCPRNPVVVELRRLRRGIGREIDSLAEDELDVSAMRRLGDSDDAIVLAETVSRVIARLRLLLTPEAPRDGEVNHGEP